MNPLFAHLFVGVSTLLLSTFLTTEKPLDIPFIAIDDMIDWITVLDEGNPIQSLNLNCLTIRDTYFNLASCASPDSNLLGMAFRYQFNVDA